MKINNLKLKNILKNYEIEEREFEYAGTNGIAELLGWQIVFFRKNENLNDTIAIAFNEITNTELINISNSILNIMKMDIRFGDNLDIINHFYGNADFIDSIYEDTLRYNYIISPDLYIVFDLTNNTLSGLEIITDENLINEIVNARKPDAI
ncbi:hypothetical protein [uncultured Clostridium sp.]|uniref:hypothetical protein n=1 Tax=uncultured Clostridium sp. TaxID=59620 RepID=UPI00272C87F4|nr:hypothetical protein [uncultured Clostridium sp.]